MNRIIKYIGLDVCWVEGLKTSVGMEELKLIDAKLECSVGSGKVKMERGRECLGSKQTICRNIKNNIIV